MASTIAALFWFIAGAASATALWLMILNHKTSTDSKRRARS